MQYVVDVCYTDSTNQERTMNDMLGREIKVGDTLVYTSSQCYPALTIGVVRDVDKNSAVIARTFTAKRSYHEIQDGVQSTSAYDPKQGKVVTKTRAPRLVTIAIPDRCLVLDAEVS
jgi:hypothetical protein